MMPGGRYKLPRSSRGRRFSPLFLIGSAITTLVVLGAFVFLVVKPVFGSHAADVNMDCALSVPANPLTAAGLATPYQLSATDPAKGPCNEANANQAAFVQGAVFDPATSQISIYNPLVIDKGTQPAAKPVTPQLPANAIVALWFGANGNTLTLQDTNGSLNQGKCVNGLNNSIFGQFAYCNAPAFFQAARQAIQAGKLTPPALGTAKDGQSCPTVRNFAVVDQDQSDNVTTTYLVTANGQSAQMTAANMTMLQTTGKPQVNGSDNRLLDIALDGSLGCSPWKVADLADPGQNVPALPLNELQAMVHQAAPVALVPANDPMALNNGQVDVNKINAYRSGVNQPPVANADAASTKTYCQNLVDVGAPRIALDAQFTSQAPSPDPAVGTTLFTFLAQRFANTYSANNLNCVQLLGKPSPITTTQDGAGVATSAMLNGQPISTQPGGTTSPTPVPTMTATQPVNPTPTKPATPTPTQPVNPTPTKPVNPTPTQPANPTPTQPANPTPTQPANPTPTPPPTGGGTGTAQTPTCVINGATIANCMGTVTINGQTCMLTFANGTVNLNCPNNPQQGNGGGNNGVTAKAQFDFNNVGTSNDDAMANANFDSWGNSFSAQALQSVGIVPGKPISFNGINFTWPMPAAGSNNVIAKGQVIPVTADGANTLGFLLAASNGPSLGRATITYTDGSTQQFLLVASDWTLNGGTARTPSYGNQVVAVTPYRNTPNGMQKDMPHIFYMDVALQKGKTIQSVTLPSTGNHGQIHVFAIGAK